MSPALLTGEDAMIARMAAFSLVALAFACAPDGKSRRDASGAGCGAGASGVAATGAWARAARGEGAMSAAYLTLCNAGTAEDALIGATSPGVAVIEIHETQRTAQSVAGMRHAKELVLPPGQAVSLAPGGRHLMLIGLLGPLEDGAKLPLTLQFRSGATKTIDVVVRAAADGGHGGH